MHTCKRKDVENQNDNIPKSDAMSSYFPITCSLKFCSWKRIWTCFHNCTIGDAPVPRFSWHSFDYIYFRLPTEWIQYLVLNCECNTFNLLIFNLFYCFTKDQSYSCQIMCSKMIALQRDEKEIAGPCSMKGTSKGIVSAHAIQLSLLFFIFLLIYSAYCGVNWMTSCERKYWISLWQVLNVNSTESAYSEFMLRIEDETWSMLKE